MSSPVLDAPVAPVCTVECAAHLCGVSESSFRRWLYRLGVEQTGSGNPLDLIFAHLVATAIVIDIAQAGRGCGSDNADERERRALAAGRCLLEHPDAEYVVVTDGRAEPYLTAEHATFAASGWTRRGEVVSLVPVAVFRERLAPLTSRRERVTADARPSAVPAPDPVRVTEVRPAVTPAVPSRSASPSRRDGGVVVANVTADAAIGPSMAGTANHAGGVA